MSFALSPSVEIIEKNVAFNVNNLPSANTAMVLECDTGPAFQRTAITTVDELEETFGTATNYNFRDWYNAWNFLQYASSLYIVRPIDSAKATQNMGLGLSGGYGGGIITTTAAYQVASMSSATATTASGLSAAAYYFKVNGIEYNITSSGSDNNTAVAVLLDTAVAAAGISVTFDATLGGFKFMHDTSGEDYAVLIADGTTVAGGGPLFAALTDFDKIDPAIVGTGLTSPSASAAYQICSMSAAAAGDEHGLSSATYGFKINGLEYTVVAVSGEFYSDLVTAMTTALTAQGFVVTFDTGIKVTNGATGTAYTIQLGSATTATDLWSACTDYDGFDVPVAGVGPGQAMTTHNFLDLANLYNQDIAETTLENLTASRRLEVYWKWVTSDASNYGIAICSDTNSWKQPCATNTDSSGTALFNNFKDYFDFEPDWAAGEFAYIIFKENSDGTFTDVIGEKKIVSYMSNGRDMYGKNIFAEDVVFTSSKLIYMKVGAATYDNVNTGGGVLPRFRQPNPAVASVTVSAGDSANFLDGDRVIFTNDANDTTGIGAEGVLTVAAGALASVTLVDVGYGVGGVGYTHVPTVTVDSGLGVMGTGTLTAVMSNLVGGTNPTCIYPLDGAATIQAYSGFSSDYTVGDIETAFDEFANPDSFDVHLIMAHERSLFYASDIAVSRKDCMSITGVVDASSIIGVSSTAATTAVVETFGYSGVVPNPTPTYSNYAAHYGNMKYQYDKYADKNRWVPVVGDVAGLFAENDRLNDPWWAVAGTNRGVMRNAIKLAFNPNSANKDLLYSNSINPVVSILGEGAAIILGQKTATSTASAFDRINVRRLLITIEKAIATALRTFMFEFNDEPTRSAILGVLNPYMSQIQARRGVYAFQVVCDDSNNTAEVIDQNGLVVNVYVKPTKVAEFIQINVVVAKTGTNFDEITTI